MEKRVNLFLFLAVVLTATLVSHAWAQNEVITNFDVWMWEGETVLRDNDGVSVWVNRGNERLGYFEFDLTGVTGNAAAVILSVWEDTDLGSGAGYPAKTSAWLLNARPTDYADALTLAAAGTVLETLGAYDVPAAISGYPQQDSVASANDRAAIQSLIGAGTARLLIRCIDNGNPYSTDIADIEWSGGIPPPAKLTLTISGGGGPVPYLSPSNGATDVSTDALLDWQVTLLAYNDPPNYTVYIDTDSDPNDGTIVSINDPNVTVYDPNLAINTTYWWRVDVTDPNSTGNPIIYTGDTWTFTTQSTTQINVETEGWLREQTDSFYENDGLNIYNSLISSGDQRRITLLEFDLSSLPPGSYSSVSLDLFSMDEWSSATFPVVSEAFIVEMNGNPIQNLTWTSYFSTYDPNIVPLDTLGAYDYGTIINEPSAYDTYVTSTGSSADQAKILAEKTGDNKLTIVIKAMETGYEVRADWEDDVYFGNRAFLTFTPWTEKAYDPTPNNEAEDVTRNISLTWLPGLDAVSHNIYLGTDFNQVKQATDPFTLPGRGNQLLGNEIYASPTPLDYETTYYWRIDEVSASGTTKGEIWSFTTISGKAKNPAPADGAYVVVPNSVLSWSAGIDAVSHHIYFGSDYDQVNNAVDPNVPPGRGTKPLGNESYLPSVSEPNTIYYWRIDEINPTDSARGDIWSFQITSSNPSTCQGLQSAGFGMIADYNSDCYVDIFDLYYLVSSWLNPFDTYNYGSLADDWNRCINPEDPNCKIPWRQYVLACLNTLIENGKDVYGPVPAPMLMAIINVDTLTSPEDPLNGFCPGFCENNLSNPVFYDACVRTEGRPCHGRLSPAGSNAWLDQPLIRSMYLCSEMSGDSKYANAADDYLSYFMNYCKKANGLFYWGSHSYWNAYSESYGGDGIHEILNIHPDWNTMYDLNPAAVTTEIDMIWDRHICDKATGKHNRHDSGSCGADFAFSGGSFAMAFSFMYAVTGQQHYLDKAKLIADWHWQSRNPTTGLLPNTYDHPYSYTSESGTYSSQLLRCYEFSGDTVFRNQAISYIKAYEQYGWDDVARNYYGMLKVDGTPVIDSGQFGGYNVKYYPSGYVDLWRTIMFTYEFPLIAAQTSLYAYEVSDIGGGVHDPELLAIAYHWAEVIEKNLPPYLGRRWKEEVEASMPDVLLTNGTYAENYGRAISFFVHLYRATQDNHHLQMAEYIATEAIQKLYTNGIFKGHPAKPYYQSNDGVGFLLYALLELDEPDNPNHGDF
ncbi:MAG: hypothetical protein JXD22_01890 [Sedimentisphaerales bacterium]|nr:hypothetical protein [Sedimentisphaerales bacterium]